ncbi:MAG: hypothetical protein WBV74_01110 [Pseudonocardiaceae bacterium]
MRIKEIFKLDRRGREDDEDRGWGHWGHGWGWGDWGRGWGWGDWGRGCGWGDWGRWGR